MNDYILPALFLLLLIAVTFKNIPAYSLFTEGARGAVDLAVRVLPFTAAILIAMELMRISGLTVILARLFDPAFSALGIPSELSELLVLRPFSGSGSIALLNGIIADYGADSYTTRAACIMMASSDTVLYVSAVYFASTRAKRTLYAIPVALAACLAGSIAACLIARVL
ncbi:MAG: hypothetical protein LBS99_06910 [Clostridiales bacterium]|nr:hypothetical protein [Clostridiales bacterium]